MKVFQTLEFQEQFKKPVLTIGNYDGIHVGHRTIIRMVKERAAGMDGTSMLMTFDPHPLQILRPGHELPSIAPLPERIRLIEETGIDVLIVVPFTREFGLIEPPDFVKGILVDRLKIMGLIIGYDFRFGRGGKGDISVLRKYGSEYGFSVDVVEPITINHEKVGSNRIRILLREGAIAAANEFLGRPYAVEGQVIRGMSRGKAIGFPTINLRTEYNLVPSNGVYITEVEFDGKKHGAVTNIGYNPTFGNTERSIETFILDFQGGLYERSVKLYFLKRLRDEVKFGSIEELKKRISADVKEARGYFENRREVAC
jgi:riboflavin kinase / FMN adenylyltransferase